MKFDTMITMHQWESIKVQWDNLFKNVTPKNPFLHFDYLRNWWNTRGGGEWDADRTSLFLLAAWENGDLIGVAPFFKSMDTQGQTSLLLLGSIEVTDYLDFLVSDTNRSEFITNVVSYLTSLDDSACKRLDLYNLLDSSPTIKCLTQSATDSGWQVQLDQLQPSPYITFPDNWETYLSVLDKKQRHEIRRKLRRAEEDVQLNWYLVDDEKALESEFNAFLDMMAQEPAKNAFLTPQMRIHMHLTAQWALSQGWLNLAFLEINGQRAAAYFSFAFEHKLWVYNSAWDIQFAQYSPGWVLLAKVIQWGIQNHFTLVDFMRGDESYKYKFGGIDRHVMRLQMHLS